MARRKPLSELSPKYRKRLEQLTAQGLTPYTARKLSGKKRDLSVRAAIGKPRPGEYRASTKAALKKFGGLRFYPELKQAVDIGDPDLIKEVQDYFAAHQWNRDPHDKELQDLKSRMDNYESEKEPNENSGPKTVWRGLKIPKRKSLDYRRRFGILNRTANGEGYYVVDLDTNSIVSDAFDTYNEAVEYIHELYQSYDSLEDE